MRSIFTLLFVLCLLPSGFAQTTSIVPAPESVKLINGKSLKLKQIKYFCQPDQEYLIRNFISELHNFGFNLPEPKKSNVNKANLIFRKTDHITGNEEYSLIITQKEITLEALTDAGLFYGLQSLVQLAVDGTGRSGLHLPRGTIQDKPRFGWRGLMLDESRHFFGKEKVKQLLDWMAYYKLNRFHWHLTDTPGWRLEILKYPKLTTIGGKGNFLDANAPAAFYTQKDIKEIIQYATERFIEVVPEIDMPGHAAAANRAYPEYSGGGSEKYPDFTFNPGKEETYRFLTDILKEVAQLFPSKYIHLGGDEVHFGNQQWNTNPEVMTLMQKLQLTNLQDVEFYFIRRMADSVNKLHKTMIGWDEIVTAGIPANKCIPMWWRQDKPEQLNLALERGYHTILCPRIPLYFDFVQSNTHHSGRYWGKEYAPLEKILGFQQLYNAPLTKYPNLIDGIQTNIWTETIDTNERLDFMTFPRIAALAEVAWGKNPAPDYSEFIRRLQPSFRLYREKRITYFDPEHPDLTPEVVGRTK